MRIKKLEMENSNAKFKIMAAAVLVVIGVAGRFVLVSYAGIPNFEIITALALVSGIYLGGVYAVAVPLSILFFSDLAIGNNYIFIFTWTAFAFIGSFGYLYGKSRKSRIVKNNFTKLFEAAGLGVGSSMFFYLYTNFGWWLTSGMYEHSLSGLLRCYWMAIPFFRNNLIGNLIFAPMGIYIASAVFHQIKNEAREIEKCYLRE